MGVSVPKKMASFFDELRRIADAKKNENSSDWRDSLTKASESLGAGMGSIRPPKPPTPKGLKSLAAPKPKLLQVTKNLKKSMNVGFMGGTTTAGGLKGAIQSPKPPTLGSMPKMARVEEVALCRE